MKQFHWVLGVVLTVGCGTGLRPSESDAAPVAQERFAGKLKSVVAIGGETTGTALDTFAGRFIELDLATNNLPFNSGDAVEVVGTFKTVSGVETGDRQVLEVTDLFDQKQGMLVKRAASNPPAFRLLRDDGAGGIVAWELTLSGLSAEQKADLEGRDGQLTLLVGKRDEAVDCLCFDVESFYPQLRGVISTTTVHAGTDPAATRYMLTDSDGMGHVLNIHNPGSVWDPLLAAAEQSGEQTLVTEAPNPNDNFILEVYQVEPDPNAP